MDTLILSRAAIAQLAQPIDYIRAVEAAFLALGNGTMESLPVGHVPGTTPVVGFGDIEAGAFIAAVGADDPGKNEIAPALMASARVVPDISAQSATMGDLRAAIQAGTMQLSGVHAELAQVVAGTQPSRARDEDVFIFDSTGTAIEDLAAADMIYERACADPAALRVCLNGEIA